MDVSEALWGMDVLIYGSLGGKEQELQNFHKIKREKTQTKQDWGDPGN